MIALKCVEPPQAEPVSLAEAKAFLKIEESITYHDRTLSDAIKASRCAIESFTGRALLEQTWQLDFIPKEPLSSLGWDGVRLSAFYKETGKLRLPKPPLVKVLHVKVNQKKLPQTQWNVVGQQLVLDPVILDQPLTVTFKAGYGTSAEDVPADLKQAVLMYAKLVVDAQGDNPTALGAIHTVLSRYRVLSL